MINVNNLKRWQLIGLVILILVPLYIVSLGTSANWDLDEGVYSEISREMVLRNDYINTYYNYEPIFDKPPLVFWLVSFFYNIFGDNEFSGRLVLVLFGFANLILLYYFAERLFNRKTALLSMFILGISFQFLIQSRIIYMDVPLTFFITLSLYFFHLGYHDDRKYYIWMGLALGLGTLVKGPVALGLPCLIFMIYLGFFTFFKEFKYKWTWFAALIYFIISLPWHIMLYLNFGSKFLNDLFGYHMFKRFSTVIVSKGGPWFYYIIIILVGLFPWSVFLPWVYSNIKNHWHDKKDSFKLLIIWFAVVFIFFTIASTKLPGYILPVYPALAMLIAYWWEQITADSLSRKKYIISNAFIIFIGILGLIGLLYLQPRIETEVVELAEVYKYLFAFPLISITGGVIFLIIVFMNKNKMKTFLVFALIAYISLFLINTVVVPMADKFKVARPLARALPKDKRMNFKVASVLDTKPASLVFYSKRKVNYLNNIEELKKFMQKNQDYYIYLNDDDYISLSKQGYELSILEKYQNGILAKNK